jgi:hypothetical protein
MLLIFFVVFIFAGSFGPDSEIAIGSFGFFGVIACLPLFLYLVFFGTAQKRLVDVSEPAIEKEPKVVDEPKYIEEEKTAEILGSETSTKEEIDKDFIESLRAEQLDIPDRISLVPEEESHDLIGRLEEERPTPPEEDIAGSQNKKSERKKEDDVSEEEKEVIKEE